jgi:hypothetical protein
MELRCIDIRANGDVPPLLVLLTPRGSVLNVEAVGLGWEYMDGSDMGLETRVDE